MNNFTTMRALPVILCSCLLCQFSLAQLIIEGGTNGVRISNRDGKTVVPASSGSSGRGVSGRTFTNLSGGLPLNSPVRSINVPNTSFRPAPTQVVTREIPAVRPTTHVIDVKKIQLINKLERELGVIKTNRFATVEFQSEMLFSGNQTGVRRSSKSILDKVIQYMSLTRGKGVSVTYDYVPGVDSASGGIERSVAVVNYLQQKSGLSIGHFCVCESEPLQRPPVQNQYSNAPRRPAKSVMEIRIQR